MSQRFLGLAARQMACATSSGVRFTPRRVTVLDFTSEMGVFAHRGVDVEHADLVAAPLEVEGFGHGLDVGLGGGVDADVGDAVAAGEGGDVDQLRAGSLFQIGVSSVCAEGDA